MVDGLDVVWDLCRARTDEAVFQAAARSARELLDADVAEYLLEEDGQLVAVASDPPARTPPTYPLVTGLVGGAYASATGCLVADSQNTRSAAAAESAAAAGEATRSLCCVPVADNGLLVAKANEPGLFTDADLELAERLAEWTGTTLDQVRSVGGRALTNGGPRKLDDPADQLEEVADILSHDLGNHLTVAAGKLELAREQGDERYLERVEGALDRIEALVDEVVNLARTGRLVDETAVVELRETARTAWAAIPTEDATLVVDSSVGHVANPRALCHLLENVMHNAVVHAGPAVTVTIGATDQGFYVEDDGPGIPAADRELVFERGYRAGDRETGLGLTIVDRIASAHGWTIRASDAEHGGARFVVDGVTLA
jgi:signal transduction histidine kinase